MNSHNDCKPAHGIAVKTRFENFNRNGSYLSLSLICVAIVAGCCSVERSRSLGNPNISANTIALQVCSNCHGLHGNSESPNFPNLAAQSQPYLVEQLKSFECHGRSDPAGFEYMWGISARLTDEQTSGLADYFSSRMSARGKARNPELLKNGQTIYEQGIAANNTPACSTCHGAKSEGVQQFPRLAGQHADSPLRSATRICSSALAALGVHCIQFIPMLFYRPLWSNLQRLLFRCGDDLKVSEKIGCTLTLPSTHVLQT